MVSGIIIFVLALASLAGTARAADGESGTISGTVTGSGSGVAALVEILSVDGEVVTQTETASDGIYAAEVPLGTYIVHFVPHAVDFIGISLWMPEYYSGADSPAEATVVEVVANPAPDALQAHVDANLAARPAIKGEVAGGPSPSYVFATSTEVPGFQGFGFVSAVTVAVDGSYVLPVPVSGTYQVAVTDDMWDLLTLSALSWWNGKTKENADDVQVVANPDSDAPQNQVNFDISSLRGTVTTSGAPTAAVVTAYDGADAVGQTVADVATGSYTLALPPGPAYRVKFAALGAQTEFYDDQPDLDLADTVAVVTDAAPDAAQHHVDADLEAGAVMSGTITAAGSPVAAQVRIFDDSDSPVATVMSDDVTGQFAAPPLADGQYRVRVSKNGHVTQYYANRSSLASADPVTVSGDALPDAAQFAVDLDLTPEVVPDPFDGLQNPSFESALDPSANWTAQRSVVTNEGAFHEPAPCLADDLRGVCVVGTDSFTDADSDTEHTVVPLDGSSMLRLGGPFTSRNQSQPIERYSVKQRFVVDGDNPVIALNYNAYMYDYTGFDEFQMRVTLKDEEGDVIFSRQQGAFASGTELKTTGWIGNEVDLSDRVGEVVSIKLEAGGTQDQLYGWWVYLDAGDVPDSDVGAPVVEPQVKAPNDTMIPITVNPGPNGQTFITVPASAPGLFEDGCLPIPLTSVPINAGQGVVSEAHLVLKNQKLPLADADGDGNYTIEGTLCAETGTLFVQYTLTEDGVSQHFTVPIGGVTLIDPQGVVFDAERYSSRLAELGSAEDCVETDAQCAADKNAARSYAAISGATVTLERLVSGDFVKVLSGDPGISPNVNPQTTSDTGLYQWDVSEGTYRVKVAKTGYVNFTTPSVVIPPPVLDLHVGLERKKPTGTIGATPAEPLAGDTVTLTLSGQHPDGPEAIQIVRWDLDDDGEFDDATGSTAAMTPPAGNHPVRAELIDDDGDRAVVATTVSVGVRPQPSPSSVVTPNPAPSTAAPTPAPTGANPVVPSVEPLVKPVLPPKPALRGMPKKIKRGKAKTLPRTASTGQTMAYRSRSPKICRVAVTKGKSRVIGRKSGVCVLRATIRPGKGLVTAKALNVKIRVK